MPQAGGLGWDQKAQNMRKLQFQNPDLSLNAQLFEAINLLCRVGVHKPGATKITRSGTLAIPQRGNDNVLDGFVLFKCASGKNLEWLFLAADRSLGISEVTFLNSSRRLAL